MPVPFFAILTALMLCSASIGRAEVEKSTDDLFLDDIQRRALEYFVREQSPVTGLVRDWAWNGPGESNSSASIAATGFALTGYGIGAERGWLSRGDALNLTRKKLLFLRDQAPQEHGFFYHFLSMDTGGRVRSSELSPIDTALAAAGVLFAGEYFDDPEIKKLARDIWERIDWAWMLNGGKTFAHAWSPERRFFPRRWASFDESLLMYFLALGSPTHPIPAENWRAFRRPIGSYGDYRLIYCPPLFTHQYPHLWIDFRNKNDGITDYFRNSKQATLAQRQFAIDQSRRISSYGKNSWGLTASDGPSGYKAYGAPPGWAVHDGTIAPTACGGSIMFTPAESLACLKHFKHAHGKKLWGRYGFSDAFNLDRKWYSKKVFAIDQGPILLAIENYRSQLIWNVMNRIPDIQTAFKHAGFQEGTIELAWKEPPELEVPKKGEIAIQLDGDLSDWPKHAGRIEMEPSEFLESGVIDSPEDLRGEIKFMWDEANLYFAAQVHDDSVMLLRSRNEIWRDDLLEFFIDPQGNGLYWNSRKDYQLGFRVDPEHSKVKTWSWFRSPGDPAKDGIVRAIGRTVKGGYVIEGVLRWESLGIKPESGAEIRLTPAFHDIDQDRSEGKLNWFFRNEGEAGRFELAHLRLKRN